METSGAQRPRLEGTRLLLRATAVVLPAVLFGGLAQLYPSPADPGAYLDGGESRLSRVQQVELRWIAERLPAVYLHSPAAGLVCPTGPPKVRSALGEALRKVSAADEDAAIEILSPLGRTHAAVAYSLGTLLYRNNRVSQADLVMSGFLELDSTRRTVRRSLDAAAAEQRISGVSADELRGIVYLMQAQALLQLEQGRIDESFWDYIKNPIGLSKQLLLMGEIGAAIEDTPTWAQARILPPGCESAEQPLSTFALYNNLLVAYMRDPSYRDDRSRQRELTRSYDDTVSSNPMLAVLRANEGVAEALETPSRGDRAGARMGENVLWAVSNAERLLRFSALPPQDPWLATNLATLVDDCRRWAPGEALEPLGRQRSALYEAALALEGRVQGKGRSALASALSRLELIEAVERAARPRLHLLGEAEPDVEERRTIARLQRALELRTDPEQLARLGVSRPRQREVREALGEGSPEWLSALRTDLAAAVARRSSEGDFLAHDRLRAALAARSLLRRGDSLPDDLRELERGLGWRRLMPQPWAFWFWLVAAAAVSVWLGRRLLRLAGWYHVQLIHRRELFHSLYQLEARAWERRRRIG